MTKAKTTPAPAAAPATAAAPTEAGAGAAWGSPPATSPDVTAPAGNGAGDGQPGPSTTPNPVGEARTVPQSEPAIAAAPVENEDKAAGQGRVETPASNLIPADAPTGATPQEAPNSPDHHDVPKNDTAGMGGETTNEEVAKATGAPLADPDTLNVDRSDRFGGPNGTGIPGYDPEAATNDDGSSNDAPTLEIVDDGPSFMDMLNNAATVDNKIARERAENPKPKGALPGELPAPLTEPIDFAPGPNEKRTDGIGSTHDASGRPVVGTYENPEPDGSGQPVYVGTAQPVANPEAGWRSNASS